MPVTPPRVSERRALHERTPSEQNRLQIRLVPYSPPRLNFDDSPPTLTRAASGVNYPASPSRPVPLAPHSQVRPVNASKDKPLDKQIKETRGRFYPPRHRPVIYSDRSANQVFRSSLSLPESSRSLESEVRHQGQSPKAPLPRRPKLINVHSNKRKTLLHPSCSSSATRSSRSARQRSNAPDSSRKHSASDVPVDDPGSPSLALTSSFSKPGSSSWNHRFLSSLRKGQRRVTRTSRAAFADLAKPSASNVSLSCNLPKAPPPPRLDVDPSCVENSCPFVALASSQSEWSNDKIYRNGSLAAHATTIAEEVNESISTSSEGASLNSSLPNVEVLSDISQGRCIEARETRCESSYHAV